MRLVFLLPALAALAACEKSSEPPEAAPGVTANISDPTAENAPITPPPSAPTPSAESGSDTVPAVTDETGPIPNAMQGRWTGMNDRCGDRAAAMELQILPDQLVFHESVGTVQTVKPDGDKRLSITAAFTGEGQSWSRTVLLNLAADGQKLTIVNDGASETRKRC